ncbi:MBL fold metallo-hydrolase [Acidithiobacillus ferrivorans]|nr:MBL fold metallo-hydrolase [Acidithiobacillus ferrivorans]
MKALPVFEQGNHRWWILYDQDEHRVIDSNVYIMESADNGILFDPGGFEIFPQVFSAMVEVIQPSIIQSAFISHQDPDIASSLPLWNACNSKIKWHMPKLWEGFIRHYGALEADFAGIPDEGGDVLIGDKKLQFVPAHYLHASANFHAYDPAAKVYFSGDVGAALLPPGHDAWLDRRDTSGKAFDAHIQNAKYFHQRWMPSNDAKRDWCQRVSQLDIDFLCPQHGAIYAGDNVQRFLNWFDGLNVGIGISR